MLNSIDELYREQEHFVKEHIGAIPAFVETLNAIVELIEIKRVLKISDNVRTDSPLICPLSYDKGMGAVSALIRDLIRKE